MNKTVATVVVTLSLFLLLVGSAKNGFVGAQANTITVPDDYAKIQWAIGNATEGDTVFVKSGTYNEFLVVNKSLSLVGENKEDTVINAQQNGPTILISQNSVTVTGFTVLNGETVATPTQYFPWGARPAGVHLLGASNCNISGNMIKNSGCGIWLYESDGNQVVRNQLIDNSNSMRLESSCDNIIEDNQLKNCFDGIILKSSGNSKLKNNTIVNANNQFGVSGHTLSDYMNMIDSSNTIDNKPIYYWTNTANKVVPSDAAYIGLVNCTNITVQNVNITKNNQAILLVHTEQSTITDNQLVNNKIGISLYSAANNIIINNNITASSSNGITVSESNNNNITQNRITNNKNAGISLDDSAAQNSISNNYLSKNYIGLTLNLASQNSIVGNQISETFMSILIYSGCDYNSIIANNMSNSDTAIWFENASPHSKGNNIIGNNMVSNAKFGILARYTSENKIQNNTIENSEKGIWISGETSINNIITGNNIKSHSKIGIDLTRTTAIIYHNNFVNNTQDIDAQSTSIWDNGSEGNYWSKYNGTDTNEDGIGDTSYIINENNQDKHPLMEPVDIATIPEFQSWVVLPLVLTATLVVAVYKKKISTTSNQSY
ncbi:MAG: hypothetical protein CW691_06830 [Candidatus Bathyarchaeum sp.]|nr:MAG: hypothetical protein CW691_06830 [Candidatus Bathyarchaeum sp.]